MNKTIIITGAAGNLGQSVVKKFVGAGYRVVATVSPGKTLGYAVSGNIDVYEADLTNEASVTKLVSEWIVKYKTIDAVALLVGGYASGNIQNTDGKMLKKMIALNFETAYYTVRPLFNHMMTQTHGGRIMVVGARTAIKPMDGKESLAYALSKSLIFQLADILNAEGAKKNVVASVIVPSTIDTPTNREVMPTADFSKWVNPDDIAEGMIYLCSDPATPLSNPVLKMYGKS
ncbi:MAG TPA: SDR family NAD(P)-dependent oxidoreductase [Ohtaekwangia sp.]